MSCSISESVSTSDVVRRALFPPADPAGTVIISKNREKINVSMHEPRCVHLMESEC